MATTLHGPYFIFYPTLFSTTLIMYMIRTKIHLDWFAPRGQLGIDGLLISRPVLTDVLDSEPADTSGSELMLSARNRRSASTETVPEMSSW